MVEFINVEGLSQREAAEKAAKQLKGKASSIERRFRRLRDEAKLIRLL